MVGKWGHEGGRKANSGYVSKQVIGRWVTGAWFHWKPWETAENTLRIVPEGEEAGWLTLICHQLRTLLRALIPNPNSLQGLTMPLPTAGQRSPHSGLSVEVLAGRSP